MFSKIGSGIMAKFFGAISIFLIAGIGLLYWELSSTKESLSKANKKIGTYEQTIAQHEQTIKDIEADKAELRRKNKIADDALVENQKEKKKISDLNQKLKSQVGRLKRENKKIKEYLDSAVDYSIIGLFRKPATQDYHYNEDGICYSSGKLVNGDACPVYTTESIVEYALEMEKAWAQCNADKKAIRDFYKKIKKAPPNEIP